MRSSSRKSIRRRTGAQFLPVPARRDEDQAMNHQRAGDWTPTGVKEATEDELDPLTPRLSEEEIAPEIQLPPPPRAHTFQQTPTKRNGVRGNLKKQELKEESHQRRVTKGRANTTGTRSPKPQKKHPEETILMERSCNWNRRNTLRHARSGSVNRAQGRQKRRKSFLSGEHEEDRRCYSRRRSHVINFEFYQVAQ